jgi:thiosulfate/3-mercaptopyruvate sulfurtransferase
MFNTSYLKSLVLFGTVVFLISACSKSDESEVQVNPDTYVNGDLLVSATDLQYSYETDNEIIIDTRTSFEAYQQGHVPGAIYFHSRRDLNDTENPIEYFLVGPEAFEELMQGIGVNNDSRLIIYDESNSLGSARLFYALEYYGFQGTTSILDGGYAAWVAAGFPSDSLVTDAVITQLGGGNFTARVQPDRQCDIAYVTGVEPGSNRIVFDVRSADEFSGEDLRAEQGGHIPGAVHLEWSEVLTTGDVNYFRPHTEIQALYDSLGITRDKEVIPHCHTNVRGSHAYFTLRLMGYDSVRPYEGSWSEYGNATGVTVAK